MTFTSHQLLTSELPAINVSQNSVGSHIHSNKLHIDARNYHFGYKEDNLQSVYLNFKKFGTIYNKPLHKGLIKSLNTYTACHRKHIIPAPKCNRPRHISLLRLLIHLHHSWLRP